MKIKLTGKNLNAYVFGRAQPVEAIEKALFSTEPIVFREYNKQVPVNFGDLRKNIKIKRGKMSYAVTTDVKDPVSNYKYPMALVQGTGSLRGAPDYGYTTGRVRANDVASGIGGIRPNKFPERTIKNTKRDVVMRFNLQLGKRLNKTQNVKL